MLSITPARLALLPAALSVALVLPGCFRYLEMPERPSDARPPDHQGPGTDAKAIDAGAIDAAPGDLASTDLVRPDAPPGTDTAVPDLLQPDSRPPLPTLPACPAKPQLLDTSQPDVTVGTGSAASCTEAALQQALTAGGTITFSCGAAPVTIKINTTLVVKKATVLDGAHLVTLDGGSKSRILHLQSYSNWTTPKLVLQRLSFINGSASTGSGGAILREGGSLMVHSCSFDSNAATEVGGSIRGGAIHADGKGDTVIVDSDFSGNSAGTGGAVSALSATMGASLTLLGAGFKGNSATGSGGETQTGGQGGAVFLNGGALTICSTEIVANTAGYLGAGIYRVQGVVDAPTLMRHVRIEGNTGPTGLGGGAYLQATQLTLADSTISANQAGGGAGLFINNSWADLINVTIQGNTASAMGGGITFGGASAGTLLNVTIAGNTGSFSGAIHGASSALWLQNSLIADNNATNIWEARSCKTPLSDGGGNLQHPPKKASGGADTLCVAGITLADPLLGPLQNNGGTTETMAVPATSPAVGKGSSCPPTDQRGVQRAAACTSGAFERD